MKTASIVLSFTTLILFTIACGSGNSSFKTPPAPGIDVSVKHDPAACPIFNGQYKDAKNNHIKMISIKKNNDRNYVLSDSPEWLFVLDGKPRYLTGNKDMSYTAYCGASSAGSPVSSDFAIVIALYQAGSPFQSIQYIATGTNDTSFAYFVADTSGKTIQSEQFDPPPTP